MPAYLIADVIGVTDPEAMGKYAAAAGPTVEKYGGKLVVAGPGEAIEGDWTPGRLVVMEFDDMATLKRWYDSPEYQAIIGMRAAASRGNLVAVETS